MGDENCDYIKLYDRKFFQNISASYITMTNIQSKIDLLKQRAIDLEAENAKLKQIIKENAKCKADNVNLLAENTKIKTENVKLKQAMGENAKFKAESLEEVRMRERIEKTMLELDGFTAPLFIFIAKLI
ncbi:hypothetical protein Glove_522g52 [Diversispora epigaea]|uniref:Uncharacterized protein n=1 Tax=Diversispora epigaea TaxID=1348612 RepID=A0A397GIR1_9GLOM|nr:hypothetical protein Glove_522g52 [Diversispora epigaea]